MKTARAIAHSNIALIKYWGKRSDAAPELNLPAVSSLSMTLGDLRTETIVGPATTDQVFLGAERQQQSFANKVLTHLDRMWASSHAEPRPPCRVETINHLPTAAGLASSASGFAALTLASAAAFELDLSREQLSSLARQGSGSAARSLWGGFVRLDKGEAKDGHDCRAYPIFAPDHWPELRLLVVHTQSGAKSTSSTDGMQRCAETSPYYPAWIADQPHDIDVAMHALEARDLEALGHVMEYSCFKMHACMMATQPAIVYWNGTTLDVIHRLRSLRSAGQFEGYATSDAGPHVKILCRETHAEGLQDALAEVPGVLHIDCVAAGPDPSLELLD